MKILKNLKIDNKYTEMEFYKIDAILAIMLNTTIL